MTREYADYTDAPWPGCPAMPAVQARIPLVCTGQSVISAFRDACGGSNSAYMYFAAGTSFATPLVAGIGALFDGTRGGGFRPQQIATIPAQTAEDVGAPGSISTTAMAASTPPGRSGDADQVTSG